MTRRVLLVIVLALLVAVAPALGQDPTTPVEPPPPALPQARLAVSMPASVPIGPRVTVTGTTDTAGRLVVVVRTAAGRILGRTVRTRVRKGAFSVPVTLADVTRPGPAVAMAILTDQTISQTEAEDRFRIAPVSPNFKLALPTSIPVGTQLPVAGEITFAGRMNIVVRTVTGRVLARRVVTLSRPGDFEVLLRLSPVARPGPIRVTAQLTSGTLSASGEATIRLTKTGPNFQLALPTSVPIGSTIPLTGNIAYAGRMVVVVRTLSGRVLGRTIVTLPRPGGFRTYIRLDPAARPGPIEVTAILSAGATSSSGKATLRLTPTGPNFQLALPTTIRAGQAIPVGGKVGFAGRLLIVARSANGRVIGRQEIHVARAGSFSSTLRINSAARPGVVTVLARLTSGTLTAEGQAALVLT